ncbi:hypothetical protein DMN91_008636 [Ooceraea biroi]|uniref:Osiris n=2 Tax=Ooceraea biroi TaxID=2015173 RepID=A0A3L8DCP6_OOCBI|nr:uncharacterized protein LOC105276103 isoform X1 [Ooceraea biroi]RLU18280.1 hypothetical protein DMN91_008636 [Ooceraea biroi]
MQMHSRALHVLALALTAVVRAGCDDKAKWYSELRHILKNCPFESRNGSGQDELLEAFRRCVQQRAINTLDALFNNDVIPVFDGIDLVRYHKASNENSTKSNDTFAFENKLGNDTSWSTIIWNRVTRILRTHAIRINIDYMFNAGSTTSNSSQPETSDNAVQGRRRHHRRRHHHLMPLMMMGMFLMGSVLIPMGFQFLAVLGGKALILAKMALILSSIQGLKKIATSGVNYGLYHHSPELHGWHDRSQQVLPEDEQHHPIYMPPHP